MDRFKNILYVSNPSVDSESAFTYAIELSRKNKAKLTVLEVIDRLHRFVTRRSLEKLHGSFIKERRYDLDELAKTHQDGVQIHVKILNGVEFIEVIREVLRENHDLIVKLALNRDGGVGSIFSSADMHLLRKCPCPVWLIKSAQKRPFKKIMAAVDLDDSEDGAVMEGLNRQILEMAFSLARQEKCKLDVVYVQDVPFESYLTSTLTSLPKREIEQYINSKRPDGHNNMTRLMGQAKERVGDSAFESVQPQTHVVPGRPRHAIAEQTRKLQTDLLVMGTVGRIGIPGYLIGNTAETVLGSVECSVLAIKPEGFATPVTLED